MKIHVEENLVLQTEDADLVVHVIDYLICNECRTYRISTDDAAIIVKNGMVYKRDRVNPEDLEEVDREGQVSAYDMLALL